MFAIWFAHCPDPAFAACRSTNRFAQASGLAAALLTSILTSSASAVAYNWNNGSGGSWTTTTNWTPNGDPNSAADTVSFGDISGPYTSTLSSNRTIGGLTMSGTNPTLDVSSTLTISGGASSIGGSASLTGTGTVLLQGGATLNWSSSSAPGGSLTFLLQPGQTASVNNAGGGFAIGSGQKLNVFGPASTVLTTLTFDAGFSNDGVIQLGSIPPGDNYSNVRLILSSGTLTNNAAGAIHLYPRSSTIYSTTERYIQASKRSKQRQHHLVHHRGTTRNNWGNRVQCRHDQS